MGYAGKHVPTPVQYMRLCFVNFEDKTTINSTL